MGEGRKPPGRRADYRHFRAIPTRWMDNDLYGHVNNVVYYSYFDTVINAYLVEAGGFDIHRADVIGVAVETSCRFHASLAFPETVEAGLRVARLGKTSVRYEVGIFRRGEDGAAAEGYFVHVFVRRADQRPIEIPDGIRLSLQKLCNPEITP